eukprot:jgi/Picsp_1/4941/NSC_02305-R1_ankyrin repeat
MAEERQLCKKLDMVFGEVEQEAESGNKVRWQDELMRFLSWSANGDPMRARSENRSSNVAHNRRKKENGLAPKQAEKMLLRFAQEGDCEAMMTLTSVYGDLVNASTACGRTLLMLCAKNGMADAVEALLQAGADVNTSEPRSGMTALLHAASCSEDKPIGMYYVAASLLEAGADVNAMTSRGVSALMIASRLGSAHLVQLLLDRGADVNAVDAKMDSALSCSMMDFDNHAVAEMLLKAGADVNGQLKAGDTMLMRAVHQDCRMTVGILLKYGADLHRTNDSKMTALMIAAREGKKELLLSLILAGARIEDVDSKGKTALLYALEMDYCGVMELLIQNHADIDVQNGVVPLIAAVKRGSATMVRFLLRMGADSNARDEKYSALMHAINHDFFDIAVELIENNADVNFQESKKGETPLMMAAEFEDPMLAEVLIDNGADLNIRNKDGHTALDLARMQKEGDDVVLLLILEASSKRRRIASAKAA